MKKIGILYGEENSFPQAFVDRINERVNGEILAESVIIDKVIQNEPPNYSVIVDRISHDIPFYRSYLKSAALAGSIVINNPFRLSQDDRFFKGAVSSRLGIPVPKSCLLPSHHRPTYTIAESFRNLVLPYNWNDIFNYLGFPNLMKPYVDTGIATVSWRRMFKIFSPDELFQIHRQTGNQVMMLEENREYEAHYRVYCVGGENTQIVPYEMVEGQQLRYNPTQEIPVDIEQKLTDHTKRLNHTLGYDFSTVDFGINEGILYALDICNPAPDTDMYGIGLENFEWLVDQVATLAIQRAQVEGYGFNHLTWGEMLAGKVGEADMGSSVEAEPVAIEEETNEGQVFHTAPSPELEMEPTTTQKDDLKKIEGIGPKIASLLNESGIYTFTQLSETSQDFLINILQKAGSRYRMHDPSTWPKQAGLASVGKWDDLKVLQDKLKGGREE